MRSREPILLFLVSNIHTSFVHNSYLFLSTFVVFPSVGDSKAYYYSITATTTNLDQWATDPLGFIWVAGFAVGSITKWSTILTVLAGSCWDEVDLHLLGNLLWWLKLGCSFDSPSQLGSTFHSFGTWIQITPTTEPINYFTKKNPKLSQILLFRSILSIQ